MTAGLNQQPEIGLSSVDFHVAGFDATGKQNEADATAFALARICRMTAYEYRRKGFEAQRQAALATDPTWAVPTFPRWVAFSLA